MKALLAMILAALAVVTMALNGVASTALVEHASRATAAAPTLTATLEPQTTTWVDDGYPPLRYQGEATALVQFSGDLAKACGVEVPAGYVLEACELPGVNKIILPNPCADEFLGQSFARLACHEKGHFNGWPGNHPRP